MVFGPSGPLSFDPRGGSLQPGQGQAAYRLPTKEEALVRERADLINNKIVPVMAKCPLGCTPEWIQFNIIPPLHPGFGTIDHAARCNHCLSYWRVNNKGEVTLKRLGQRADNDVEGQQ